MSYSFTLYPIMSASFWITDDWRRLFGEPLKNPAA
jgi:hypothetical protein